MKTVNKKLSRMIEDISEHTKSTPERVQIEQYINSITGDEQTQTVLRHLILKGPITSMEAFRDYNITRLSAVIFDLRKAGADIDTLPRYTEKGKRYAAYYIREVS